MHLSVLPQKIAICRLPPESPLPNWATKAEFWSITRTRYELSVVTEQKNVPEDITADFGWRILKVRGPLDLDMTGVLADLSLPLTIAGVNLFSVSTYDTDFLLVPEELLAPAIVSLRETGHEVIEVTE